MSAPRHPSKPATLHDVAREAGVSLITASRALSKPSLVSDQTIARVKQAVEATGYLPNLLAGGLKSRRSRLIAGILPALSVAQFLPTFQSLTSALETEGYQLILGQSSYDPAREERLINAMISRRPDGLFMTGLVHNESARQRLAAAGIPVVESWDFTDRPIDMLVGFSHVKVGAAIAGFFLSKGWKHIGVATGDDHRARLRCEAFQSTLGREVPTVWVPAPSGVARGREALRRLLATAPGLDAVYCSSDQMAQGVIVEAQQQGIRVPEQLVVCGFGDAEHAAHLSPSITTVGVEGARIGELAAQMIMDRCEGKQIDRPVVDLGFRIIERDSTRR